MSEERTKEVKKITLSLILGWGFGVLTAISGIALIFSHPLTGILALLLAAVLLPPANKIVADKLKFSISGGLKAVVVIILLVLVGVSMPSTPSAPAAIENAQVTAENQNPTPANVVENKTPAKAEAKPASITTPVPTQVKQPASQNTAPISSETVSQINAVKKAKSYLSYSAYSHDGLVAQLEYEQFSHADAVYGADNSDANWNEQAAKKAKSYMGYSAFSRGSLITQLEYEKFTQAQAEYGANAVGL